MYSKSIQLIAMYEWTENMRTNMYTRATNIIFKKFEIQ